MPLLGCRSSRPRLVRQRHRRGPHPGPTLGSFVGLTEVIFAVLFAWLVLDELPAAVQLAGGALIVAGVALVRLDELARGLASRTRRTCRASFAEASD